MFVGFVGDCLVKVFQVHCGALLHHHSLAPPQPLFNHPNTKERPLHLRCCCPDSYHLRVSRTEMAAQRCEVVETDEAGNVTATYVQTAGSKESLSRVDVIQPQDTKALWQKTLDIFLPSGYPHSVTDDYLE